MLNITIENLKKISKLGAFDQIVKNNETFFAIKEPVLCAIYETLAELPANKVRGILEIIDKEAHCVSTSYILESIERLNTLAEKFKDFSDKEQEVSRGSEAFRSGEVDIEGLVMDLFDKSSECKDDCLCADGSCSCHIVVGESDSIDINTLMHEFDLVSSIDFESVCV